MNLYTIGFTQKNAETFFGLLDASHIQCLVDVRLNPNGQLSRFAFEKDLPFLLEHLVHGCQYSWRPDLAPTSDMLKEVRTKGTPMNADYEEFARVFKDHVRRSSNIGNFADAYGDFDNVCLLCSEPTTEKCHRRLVGEVLLERFPGRIGKVTDL